jgi:hypothetical protein
METDFVKEIISATPLRRLGQAEDIGLLAVFLASARITDERKLTD